MGKRPGLMNNYRKMNMYCEIKMLPRNFMAMHCTQTSTSQHIEGLSNEG